MEACQVVDALGPDVRLHLVERFVALELKEYRRIFRTNDEAGQLDNLSRRLAWFRRLLQTHEIEQGRVFPSEWRVGWYLLAKFTEITRYTSPFGYKSHSHPSFFLFFFCRDDVVTLLTKLGSNFTLKSLLDNLAITTEFEQSMSKKWATSVCLISDLYSILFFV